MRGFRRVGMRHYRRYRLEMLDDGAEGWAVTIHPPAGAEGRVVLRNKVPSGLSVLVEEAEGHVDRLLDGPSWRMKP